MLEEALGDEGNSHVIPASHDSGEVLSGDRCLLSSKPTSSYMHMQAHEIARPPRPEKAGLGRTFQHAVSAHEWAFAESLIPFSDRQRLNDGLCVVLDSIWFLPTQQEVSDATRLIERLVEFGADDFSRAALRTSFLASCVSACRSRAMSLADTVTVMAQR